MTGFVLVRLLQTEGPIVSAPRPKFVTRIPVRARLLTEAGAHGGRAETANQLILIVVTPEVLAVTPAQALLSLAVEGGKEGDVAIRSLTAPVYFVFLTRMGPREIAI